MVKVAEPSGTGLARESLREMNKILQLDNTLKVDDAELQKTLFPRLPPEWEDARDWVLAILGHMRQSWGGLF